MIHEAGRPMTQDVRTPEFTLGSALLIAVLVGVPLRFVEWWWLDSGTSVGENPGRFAMLLLAIGPLLNAVVGLAPGWIAGWFHPRNGIMAGAYAGLIIQVIAIAVQFQRYGGFLPDNLGGIVAGLLGSALLAGSAAGAAQLIRASGGFNAYFGIAGARPTAPGMSPTESVSATAPTVPWFATLAYFALGILCALGAAIGLAILTADKSGSIEKLVVAGLLWLAVTLGALVAGFFVLRRRPAALYIAIAVFVSVMAVLAATSVGF